MIACRSILFVGHFTRFKGVIMIILRTVAMESSLFCFAFILFCSALFLKVGFRDGTIFSFNQFGNLLNEVQLV